MYIYFIFLSLLLLTLILPSPSYFQSLVFLNKIYFETVRLAPPVPLQFLINAQDNESDFILAPHSMYQSIKAEPTLPSPAYIIISLWPTVSLPPCLIVSHLYPTIYSLWSVLLVNPSGDSERLTMTVKLLSQVTPPTLAHAASPVPPGRIAPHCQWNCATSWVRFHGRARWKMLQKTNTTVNTRPLTKTAGLSLSLSLFSLPVWSPLITCASAWSHKSWQLTRYEKKLCCFKNACCVWKGRVDYL